MLRVLGSDDIRRLVSMADAITAAREAFAAADLGAVTPAPFAMHLPDADGEIHLMGAYVAGAPVLAVKSATGFHRNADKYAPDSIDDERTVADLTGFGVQDAAVAGLAARFADENDSGDDVPLGDW